MCKTWVWGCCVSLVICLSGCGPAYDSNSILKGIPDSERNQIDSVLKHASSDVYLPTKLPFQSQHAHASATKPELSGRSLSQTVTISFNNQTELLKEVQPDDLTITNNTIALKDGVIAYYRITSHYSTLNWQDYNGSFALYSATIKNGNVNTPLKPDLTEQQLANIASTIK